MKDETKLALITKEDLGLTEKHTLNDRQLKQLLKKTPPQFVKKRPAKGGGEWDYVTGGYVKKCLNLMFGWDWDFEIVDQMIEGDEVIVKGRLTCRTSGKTIVKMQFGNKDIVYKKADEKGERKPLSIGNDMKAAATDCLKKCAAEIGIAADIYNKEDFREVEVSTSEDLYLVLLKTWKEKKETLKADFPDMYEQINQVIELKDEMNYNKAIKQLNTL